MLDLTFLAMFEVNKNSNFHAKTSASLVLTISQSHLEYAKTSAFLLLILQWHSSPLECTSTWHCWLLWCRTLQEYIILSLQEYALILLTIYTTPCIILFTVMLTLTCNYSYYNCNLGSALVLASCYLCILALYMQNYYKQKIYIACVVYRTVQSQKEQHLLIYTCSYAC